MSGWYLLVAALVTGILLARGRANRARRLRDAHGRGEPVRVPVRLSGEAPYLPPGPVVGWVHTGGPAPEWRPRRGGGRPFPLVGARLLRTEVPAGPMRAEFVLVVQLPDGFLVRLATGFPYLELLQDILGGANAAPAPVDLTKNPAVPHAGPPYAGPPYAGPPYPGPPYPGPPYPGPPYLAPPAPVPPRGPVPWWSATLLGLTLGWAGIWGWFWLSGTILDATVVENPNGPACQVEWVDPESTEPQRNRVDCPEDARPGDVLRVLVMPDRLGGTAMRVGPAIAVPLVVGASAILIALAGIFGRLRTRRAADRTTHLPVAPVAAPYPSAPYAGAPYAGAPYAGAPYPAGPVPPAQVPGTGVPVLGEGEVIWSRIVEVMGARAAAEGWAATGPRPPSTPEAVPEGPPQRWWHVQPLRRLASRSALRLLLPLVIGALAVGEGWGGWVTTAKLAAGDTRVSQGVVTKMSDDALLPFLPEQARIHYRVDGRTYDRWAPAGEDLRQGQEVSFLYAASDPGRIRLEGDEDRLPQEASVTGIVAALAAALMARRVTRTHRYLAGLARARRGPARSWRFVRFRDHTGRPGVMLFSRFADGPPAVLVPLVPGGDESRWPVSGEADIHGEVADGAIAVPVIDGRTCWPVGRAAEVPPQAVRDLVNGTLPVAGLARLAAGGRAKSG